MIFFYEYIFYVSLNLIFSHIGQGKYILDVVHLDRIA